MLVPEVRALDREYWNDSARTSGHTYRLLRGTGGAARRVGCIVEGNWGHYWGLGPTPPPHTLQVGSVRAVSGRFSRAPRALPA